mgnify:CR=1 FL=1
MRLHTVRERCQLGQTLTLYPLGDVHFGSANCDVGLFLDTIQAIKDDPDARWIGVGDYCEWITVKDKRWHAGGIDTRYVTLENVGRLGDHYVGLMGRFFAPIIDKCWGFGDGNHESKFCDENGTDLCTRILKEAGAPGEVVGDDWDSPLYSGWAALTRVCFEDANRHRSAVRIYSSHGWQGGRMDGAKVNQMQRLLAWIDADIYLHGHSHSRFIVPVDRLRTNHDFTAVKADRTYVAHTGSFLKTYQKDAVSYAERAGYPPTSLGTVRFHLTPTMKGVEIEGVQ